VVAGEVEVVRNGVVAFGWWLVERRPLVVIGEGREGHEEGCGGRRLLVPVLVEEAGRVRSKEAAAA
jgi:hypothetical protein